MTRKVVSLVNTEGGGTRPRLFKKTISISGELSLVYDFDPAVIGESFTTGVPSVTSSGTIVPPLTFTKLSGVFGDDMALNASTGEISIDEVVGSVGDYVSVIKVVDSSGKEGTAEVTITVEGECEPWIADDVTTENLRAMGNDSTHSYVAEIVAESGDTKITKILNSDGSIVGTLELPSTLTFRLPCSILVDATYIHVLFNDYDDTNSVLLVTRILKSDFSTTESVTLDVEMWVEPEDAVTFVGYQMAIHDDKLYAGGRRNGPDGTSYKLYKTTSFASPAALTFDDAGMNYFEFEYLLIDLAVDKIYLPGFYYDDPGAVFALVVVDEATFAETDRVAIDAGEDVDNDPRRTPITQNVGSIFIGFAEDEGEFAGGMVKLAKSGYTVEDAANYSDSGNAYVKWMDQFAGLRYADDYVYASVRGGALDQVLGRIAAGDLSVWDIQTTNRRHASVHDSLFMRGDNFYSPFEALIGATGGVVKLCGFTPD